MRIIVVKNGFDMSMCVCVLQNIVGLNIKLVVVLIINSASKLHVYTFSLWFSMLMLSTLI